jgi:hypothetical protein
MTDNQRLLKVFLNHISENKPVVRDLYKRLTSNGMDVWLDEERVLPGMDWRLETEKAIKQSDAIIICLSRLSIQKEGYYQREMRLALDVALEKSEEGYKSFIIPLRLEECEIPESLRKWQGIDLFQDGGYEKLIRALQPRANIMGKVVPIVGNSPSDIEEINRNEPSIAYTSQSKINRPEPGVDKGEAVASTPIKPVGEAKKSTRGRGVKQASKGKKRDSVPSSAAESASVEDTTSTDQHITYKVRVVAKTGLNVRSGPGISYSIVRQLNTDDVVEVFSGAQDSSGNLWARVGPDQWIVIQEETTVRIPEVQDKPIDGTHKTVAKSDTTNSTAEIPATPEDAEANRLQAANLANLLANNRSQALFNDKAQGEDQLGIKNEVEALAETLLLRDVEPPVAVGVMGGWGSGKSFVMYLINQYVQRIRAQRVKKGWAVFVGHLYQIHFNAWTYAKSNLWASLMDTIFSTLNRQMQLEQLLAYTDIDPSEKIPQLTALHPSLKIGGEIYKRIYEEGYQPARDSKLTDKERLNLTFWGSKLLSKNLLWHVMRSQNEKTLEDLRDNEEKLAHLKARRDALEKNPGNVEVLPAALGEGTEARSAYHQLLQTTLLGFVSDTIGKSIRDKLKNKDINEQELLKLQADSKSLLQGYKGLFAAFQQNRYFVYAAFSFAVITLALPYIFEIFGRPIVDFGLTKIIAFISAVAPILQAFLTRARKVLEFEQETKKAFESAYETQRKRQAEEIVSDDNKTLEEKEKALEDKVRSGSLPALNALITLRENQIEQQRQQVGPSAKYASLLEFVQSRLDAATYENQLGLMHQVRQDIDELTYSLVDNANPEFFPRGKPRVILYIDDLDRCPPSRVVEVLEAVQLLLNTKLFIVILGLDTRYVTRALEKEYKEILQHEGDPSGLDYIEKIIQIPYRVRAIEPTGLRTYIEKQMDIEKLVEAAKTESLPASTDEVQTTPQATEQSTPTETVTTQQPSAEDQHTPSVEATVQTPTENKSDVPPTETPQTPLEEKQPEPEPEALEIELPAAVVQFKQEDLEDLAICCQKIVLTPRSIKRLVNVFKLMKIFWFRADKDAGLAERDRPRSVKQAAICLLALSSAYPEVMREVFVQLDVLYRQGRVETDLFTALNNIVLPPGSASELSWQHKKYKSDLAALKSIAGNGQEKFGQLSLQTLMLSTFNIVRSFSFVGDPVYWTDGEEESEPPVKEEKIKAPTKRSTKKKTDLK